MKNTTLVRENVNNIIGKKLKADREPMLRATHLYRDPLLPTVPDVPGLHCEDHATFVAAADEEQAFRRYWSDRGLGAMKPYVPDNYPARHIAFAEDAGNTVACEDMIGLSVSDDRESPINKMVQMWGGHHLNEAGDIVVGRLQHIAYNVQPEYDMVEIREKMEEHGVCFMTPLLTFTEKSGAHLKQMFIACKVAYGPFIEIIQRGLSPEGKFFQGFNADQIDVLYKHYDAYSRKLIEHGLMRDSVPVAA